MEIEWQEERRSPFFKALFPAYIVLAILYLYLRFFITLGWDDWYAWPLFASEAFGVAMTLLYLATSRRMVTPVFRPAPRGKTVDIFIPTYNEPEEIVKGTTIGALHVRGVRHVFVLDDGDRPHIRAMAKALGARYIARGDNTHAKAGNMNAGLKESDAEFIIFFDCDHVPQPEFIERTLGYFDDPKLAFVQTPQLFYNTNSVQFRKTAGRPLWNEQSMFYESIQPSKNCYNAAFFCGSGAILRRSAVDAIGGFATGTATEDIHTSLRLHAHGWRSIFLPEQLAHGLAPGDLGEYHKQRTRWGAGSLGLLLRSKDSPLFARGLTLAQRVCYFNSTFSFTFGLQRMFYLALPAGLLFAMAGGVSERTVPVAAYLALSFPFLVFSYFCTWVHSNRTFHPLYTEQYNVANMFSHLMAIRGVIQVQKKFAVSEKMKGCLGKTPIESAIGAVCVLLILANFVGVAAWIIHRPPAGALLTNPAALAFFWNSLNLCTVMPFYLFLREHRARRARTHTVAIPAAPALLASGPQKKRGSRRRQVTVTELSIGGGRVACSGPAFESDDLKLVVDTGDGKLNIAARILAREEGADGASAIDLSFADLPPRQAELLTRFLFHGVVPQTLRYGPVEARSTLVASTPVLRPLMGMEGLGNIPVDRALKPGGVRIPRTSSSTADRQPASAPPDLEPPARAGASRPLV